jgi:hypothetical protein
MPLAYVINFGNFTAPESKVPDPSDVDSAPTYYHGSETISAPGYGVIAHFAGFQEPDGTHHGLVRSIDDPSVAAELRSALGA